MTKKRNTKKWDNYKERYITDIVLNDGGIAKLYGTPIFPDYGRVEFSNGESIRYYYPYTDFLLKERIEPIKIHFCETPMLSIDGADLSRKNDVYAWECKMQFQILIDRTMGRTPSVIHELIGHNHDKPIGSWDDPLGTRLVIEGKYPFELKNIYVFKYSDAGFLTIGFALPWSKLEKLFNRKEWARDGELLFFVRE